MLRIIREVRPRFAFVENSPLLTSRGLDRVLGDLASAGFDAEWGVLSAADVGAPHLRKRIWIVAADTYSAAIRDEEQRPAAGRVGVQDSGVAESRDDGEAQSVADADEARSQIRVEHATDFVKASGKFDRSQWWEAEPDVGRVAHGVAARVDRLRAIGNGQVPLVAASAWRQLLARFGEGEP
jgi:DNA (cytosine-5)-methyltransferase 1